MMPEEAEFDYKQLDDLICSRIRLAILSVLVSVPEADFKFLKSKTKATDGNLSVHLKKLEDAEYLKVDKAFVDRKPKTTYKLSLKGKKAFKEYVKRLESLLN